METHVHNPVISHQQISSFHNITCPPWRPQWGGGGGKNPPELKLTKTVPICALGCKSGETQCLVRGGRKCVEDQGVTTKQNKKEVIPTNRGNPVPIEGTRGSCSQRVYSQSPESCCWGLSSHPFGKILEACTEQLMQQKVKALAGCGAELQPIRATSGRLGKDLRISQSNHTYHSAWKLLPCKQKQRKWKSSLNKVTVGLDVESDFRLV